tara:strand:- start:514 stop:795 length:282 start_codon:yes stop_codon:yes gene_type:complete
MNTEEFTGLDKDMQALNFKVIQSIKTKEDELVKNVLKDYLKRDVKGKDLKFIGKQFDMVRKNVYFLYFKDELLGAIEYIMKDNKVGLSFEPMS